MKSVTVKNLSKTIIKWQGEVIYNGERYPMYKSNEENQKKKKKADIFGYTKLEDICVLKGKPKTSKFNTGLDTEHL